MKVPHNERPKGRCMTTYAAGCHGRVFSAVSVSIPLTRSLGHIVIAVSVHSDNDGRPGFAG